MTTKLTPLIFLSALALSMPACATQAPAPRVDYASILADPIRPEADRVRDSDRRPAELIAFAGVRPGTGLPSWRRAAAISPAS